MGGLSGLIFSFFGSRVLYSFGNLKIGYVFCATAVGLLMVVGMLISTSVCKKYDNAQTQLAYVKKEKMTLRQMLQSINKSVVILFIAVAFSGSASTLLPSLLVYYFSYVLNNTGLLSVYMLVVSFSTLLGQSVAEQAARRFGK